MYLESNCPHCHSKGCDRCSPVLIPGITCWCDHRDEVHSPDLGCRLCDCTAGRIIPRLQVEE